MSTAHGVLSPGVFLPRDELEDSIQKLHASHATAWFHDSFGGIVKTVLMKHQLMSANKGREIIRSKFYICRIQHRHHQLAELGNQPASEGLL